MRRAKEFAEWLWGPLHEPYTWLILISFIGAVLLPGWRGWVCLGIELATFTVGRWTAEYARSVTKGDGDGSGR